MFEILTHGKLQVTTILLAGLLAGCQPKGPPPVAMSAPEPSEPSLSQQIAAVKSGQSRRIQLEYTGLGDNDLVQLQGLDQLSELLADHPSTVISAQGIKHLEGLPNLTHLRIRGAAVVLDDEAMQAISRLKSLRILNLPWAMFTDAGLAELKALPELEQLRFASANVTDAGMITLQSFPSLKRLHLIDVPITDRGLAELTKIERLESLYIDGGLISDAAWDELFCQRPKLHVHINQQHHDRDPQKHEHGPPDWR